jgi:hypothetical protein
VLLTPGCEEEHAERDEDGAHESMQAAEASMTDSEDEAEQASAALDRASGGGVSSAQTLVAQPLEQQGASALLTASAAKAAVRLQRKRDVAARTFNAVGDEVPYVRTELRRTLVDLDRHMVESTGLYKRITQLHSVVDAAKTVVKLMPAAHKWRAISLDDALMSEAWLVLHPSFAADSFLMGVSGFGECMGPRGSDIFAALLKHFEASQTGNDLRWHRFAGKNNPSAEKRERLQSHADHCELRQASRRHMRWSEASAVTVDPEHGVLPETRCGVCSLRRLFALQGDSAPYRSAFLRLTRKAKLSWEDGATPMERQPDGTYDGACWFQADEPNKPMTVDMINTLFRKWGERINERRALAGIDPLDLTLFRSHSLRHGAAKNMKRLGIDLDAAAAHLCMSRDVLERVYGIDDATVAGARVTGAVVRSAQQA